MIKPGIHSTDHGVGVVWSFVFHHKCSWRIIEFGVGNQFQFSQVILVILVEWKRNVVIDQKKNSIGYLTLEDVFFFQIVVEALCRCLILVLHHTYGFTCWRFIWRKNKCYLEKWKCKELAINFCVGALLCAGPFTVHSKGTLLLTCGGLEKGKGQ